VPRHRNNINKKDKQQDVSGCSLKILSQDTETMKHMKKRG
jgi:hypothetical protein